jgi:hypothetical protein
VCGGPQRINGFAEQGREDEKAAVPWTGRGGVSCRCRSRGWWDWRATAGHVSRCLGSSAPWPRRAHLHTDIMIACAVTSCACACVCVCVCACMRVRVCVCTAGDLLSLVVLALLVGVDGQRGGYGDDADGFDRRRLVQELAPFRHVRQELHLVVHHLHTQRPATHPAVMTHNTQPHTHYRTPHAPF